MAYAAVVLPGGECITRPNEDIEIRDCAGNRAVEQRPTTQLAMEQRLANGGAEYGLSDCVHERSFRILDRSSSHRGLRPSAQCRCGFRSLQAGYHVAYLLHPLDPNGPGIPDARNDLPRTIE